MSLQSGEVGVDIPEYAQYRLGGANTIRGYDVEKLGRELFGRNQLLGTVEYSFRVVPPRLFSMWKLNFRLGLELALLGDVGVAWNESHELNSRRTRAGLGAGVRLLVPGSDMVRVDVGWSPEGGFPHPPGRRDEARAPARPAALASPGPWGIMGRCRPCRSAGEHREARRGHG